MDGCRELNKVGAIYEPRKQPVEGEAEPPWKRARPAGLMGLGHPAYPLSGPPRSHHSRGDSSHLRGLGPLGSLGGWMCMNELRINMGFGLRLSSC